MWSHVEAIRPSERVIKLTDGSAVPNFKLLQRRFKNMVFIPENQDYLAPKRQPTRNIFASKTVYLQPKSENFGTASTPQTGFLRIKPYWKLYEPKQCAAMPRTAHVEAKKYFIVKIANFGNDSTIASTCHRITTAATHPSTASESLLLMQSFSP